MGVLADRVALRHRLDHRAPKVLRMRAREADALDALDGIARAEQLAELSPEIRGEIAPPRVHVLAEQRHLAHSFAREPRHLRHDLSGPAADLASPNRRHDAVRTLRVTAHRDLHPRLERALAVHRQLAGEGPVVQPEPATRDAEPARSEPLAEVRNRSGPERDVHARIEREQPLALSF